jgi:hypothetical protein
MSSKPTKAATPELKDLAKKFAHQLVQTANDNDPGREAEFQKREAAREEEVTAALKKHLAKKKPKKSP